VQGKFINERVTFLNGAWGQALASSSPKTWKSSHRTLAKRTVKRKEK
jgi:hypothetical protein